ncbi:MAG: hypothetical protein IPL65_03490 [Lewinellaceae bacterium]|nr:hypothetical protein [Lewinellaceae bacterium]
MKKNEEYVPNTRRDWMLAAFGGVLTVGLLLFSRNGCGLLFLSCLQDLPAH